MRILFVTSTYPTPTQPNQGTFNEVLVGALRQYHDVRVLAPVPWTQIVTRLSGSVTSREDSLEEKERWVNNLFPISYYPPKIFRKYYDRFLWASIRSAVIKMSRTFTPDVVFGYWLHPDGAAAVRAAAHFGVPAIVISGGTDLRVLAKIPERGKEIANVMHAAERVIVLSRELSHHARQLGIAGEKIDIVYRGVDRNVFRPMHRLVARQACRLSPEQIIVFWAGRLVPIKNPTLVLRAAAKWKNVWQGRLRVILAGEGPLRRDLEELRISLGLQENVALVGNLSQQDLARHYNSANVTVLTSHSEGTPNVLLESIACGTPFVATDVGGVSEIATPDRDFLFADNDLESLVASVQQAVGLGESISPRVFEPTNMNGMIEQLQLVINRALACYHLSKNAA